MVNLKFKSTLPNVSDFEIEFEEAQTVLELKQAIVGRISLPVENIRLVRNGRVFDDPFPVSTYAPHEGFIHILNNPRML